MPEDSKEIPNQLHSHSELVASDAIAIMQQVAPGFGVTIQILAKEGEQYRHEFEDKNKGQASRTYTDEVPKGKLHIKIGCEKPDLGAFYDAVRAEQKVQQSPANRPKI